jgi:hypothetical protein
MLTKLSLDKPNFHYMSLRYKDYIWDGGNSTPAVATLHSNFLLVLLIQSNVHIFQTLITI